LRGGAAGWPRVLESSDIVSAMGDDTDAVLLETLEELDLPRRMLMPWLVHNRAFCEAHGGRRTYPGLLDLLDRCDRALVELDLLSPPSGKK
jgi:hypothetical protein